MKECYTVCVIVVVCLFYIFLFTTITTRNKIVICDDEIMMIDDDASLFCVMSPHCYLTAKGYEFSRTVHLCVFVGSLNNPPLFFLPPHFEYNKFVTLLLVHRYKKTDNYVFPSLFEIICFCTHKQKQTLNLLRSRFLL
jgi:hypothetical protein